MKDTLSTAPPSRSPGHEHVAGWFYQLFVLTHDVPEHAAKGENEKLTFTFVTAGIESAIEKARAAAGDKQVTVIGGADIAQQCIEKGLVDELEIGIVPVLLGDGLRLFEQLNMAPIDLQSMGVIQSAGAAFLRFRVVK